MLPSTLISPPRMGFKSRLQIILRYLSLSDGAMRFIVTKVDCLGTVLIAAAASEPEANERGSSLISRRLLYRGLQSLFFTKRKELWLCANGRSRMCSGMRKELWLCANGNILGCAVICAFLWRFRFLLIFFRSLLRYLKDCNVSAHSVDSDIFYVVINLSAGSKS